MLWRVEVLLRLGDHVKGRLSPLSLSPRATTVSTTVGVSRSLVRYYHCHSATRRGRLDMNSKRTREKEPSKPKPPVIFVLGRPGSGKGTQCTLISQEYGFTHLSAGDLLREERENPKSEFGNMIETHIRNGTIVPVEVTCALLEKAMIYSRGTRFLIDGFPRSRDNLEGWQNQMSHKVDLKFVLYFDCPEEECVRRCLERGQCGSGRSDDNPESLQKRVVTYSNVTQPIIDHYIELDMVQKVDAADDKEKVFERVRAVFDSYGFKRGASASGDF